MHADRLYFYKQLNRKANNIQEETSATQLFFSDKQKFLYSKKIKINLLYSKLYQSIPISYAS